MLPTARVTVVLGNSQGIQFTPAETPLPHHMDMPTTRRFLQIGPGTNFSSTLKSPVFFEGWGRAGMLGLHFVLTRTDAHATASTAYCLLPTEKLYNNSVMG